MVKGKNTMDMVKSWIPIIGVVIALGGGFIKYGEIKTQLIALSEKSGPDLTPIAKIIGDNQKNISTNISGISDNEQGVAVLEKEIELLKIQIEEIKVSTDNPLSTN